MDMHTTYTSILPLMQFKPFIKILEEDFRFEESEIFLFRYDTTAILFFYFIFLLKVSFMFKKWESKKYIKYNKNIINI